ncbi:MAG: alpha/beta hydrolase [Pseudomonadota bacterium]
MDYSRRSVIKLPIAAALSGATVGVASAASQAPSAGLQNGEFYAEVDDFRMSYEVRGQGPLLIHQTGVWTFDAKAMMRPLNEKLAEHFTVLTMDVRGQGRSSLGEGPTSYARAAADTVRLMDSLDIEKAHFFGVSDGGCIQLDLLLTFEDRVASSSLCGTPYSHDAYKPKIREALEAWRREMLEDSETFFGISEPLKEEELEAMRTQYAQVSPHPELFIKVMKERRRCWSTEPDVSLRRLSAINRPVLVINAGADEYIPKTAFDALEQAIPDAKSVYFSDLKHVPFSHADQIARAVRKFTSDVDAPSGD